MPTKKNTPAKKKAAKKAAPGNAVNFTPPQGMALVALQPNTVAATVKITFSSGVGKLTAFLSRNGTLINMQSITRSADIFFSDVKSGDGLALVGASAGSANIVITVPTSPNTPQTVSGPIHKSYIIQ
ncbi:hypothetical protein HB364_29595 [Pseudoflavitalea sp. X16]|uniref:hypothetical protein n=1 Tax=Paraflavitalea devenefica TaxID=2716334 RepID=UPI001423C9F2|nr:hypothetical protein [Paraflavitalea devenefica]NII29270.1 hypothetical protein [Paraflavitalea devenefica]